MMDDNTVYKTGDAEALFGVSGTTIRRWCEEFDAYLTPDANPGTGSTRMFTVNDLRVFALISDMKNRGKTFAEIKERLDAGDRGSIILPVGKMPHELGRDVQIELLTQQLELAESKEKEYEDIIREKDKKIVELETRLEERSDSGKVEQLQSEIIQLNRKLAVLEYMMEEKKGEGDSRHRSESSENEP